MEESKCETIYNNISTHIHTILYGLKKKELLVRYSKDSRCHFLSVALYMAHGMKMRNGSTCHSVQRKKMNTVHVLNTTKSKNMAYIHFNTILSNSLKLKKK